MALAVKNLPTNAGDIRDTDSIPGLGRSPGEGHGNPLQYFCLENPHGQRSLVGYSPWGSKELDRIERLSTEQQKFKSLEQNKMFVGVSRFYTCMNNHFAYL